MTAAINGVTASVTAAESQEQGVLEGAASDLFVPKDPGGDLSPATSSLQAKVPNLGHALDGFSSLSTTACTPLSAAIPALRVGSVVVPLPAVYFDYCLVPYRPLIRDLLLVTLIVYYVGIMLHLATSAFREDSAG